MNVMLKYKNLNTSFFIIFWYTDGTSRSASKNAKAGEWTYFSAKSDSNKTLKGIAFSFGTNDLVELKEIMVSSGSTPYEPYGIKIPISSGGENLVDRTTCAENKLLVWATGGLYNEGGSIATDFIRVKSGDELVSNYNSQKMFYDKNEVYLGTLLNDGTLAINTTDYINTGKNFTVPNVADIAYMRLGYRKPYNTGVDMLTANIMLNRGSTVLPYEPYIEPTETNIYLGEVQTTRRIRKLVLDGSEGWLKYSGNFGSYLYYLGGLSKSEVANCICTHVEYKSIVPNSNIQGVRMSDSKTTLLLNCGSEVITENTVTAFKEYLARQYAAGTPVTVWYVLATAETGIVNEPLRKIGDYADTLSYEQAGVQIPTNRGNTVIDVETELKPSEMTLNWHGWHTADVKEYSNGEWR